jgi:sigma-B regulation protein RsbU (phosphoserine phosphatase)
LNEARELQENLLTTTPPELNGFEIALNWQPAETVGGDYVSAFNIDDENVALCVADVVGKGMPAALLMSNFQAALKSLAAKDLSPAEVSDRLNRQLYSNIPLHKFVTAFYAVVNTSMRTITFTNSGHNPPLLMREDGECVRLNAGGSVLGGFLDMDFDQQSIQLRTGDRLLLFTDGLTEAMNEYGEQFDEERLIQLLRNNKERSAEELKEILFSAVGEFCNEIFEDDAALMVVAVV